MLQGSNNTYHFCCHGSSLSRTVNKLCSTAFRLLLDKPIQPTSANSQKRNPPTLVSYHTHYVSLLLAVPCKPSSCCMPDLSPKWQWQRHVPLLQCEVIHPHLVQNETAFMIAHIGSTRKFVSGWWLGSDNKPSTEICLVRSSEEVYSILFSLKPQPPVVLYHIGCGINSCSCDSFKALKQSLIGLERSIG